MGKPIAIVALGGNALTPKEGKGTYKELKRNIAQACRNLFPLFKTHGVVVVSGSGPQIGSLLLQNELAKKTVPPMPLDVLDAELEGWLGYMMQQELMKVVPRQLVVTVITQVLVDKRDPLLKHPTKPIGRFYTRSEASVLERRGLKVVYQRGKGYRRVVPSPKPVKVMETEAIKQLLKKKMVVIAAVGGGVPIVKTKSGVKGVNGVVDKDRASACLAKALHADMLLILTDVKKVSVNYNIKNQRALSRLHIEEIKEYMRDGQFPPGSMGPKMESAMEFVRGGGKKVIITCPSCVAQALKGKEGTVITR